MPKIVIKPREDRRERLAVNLYDLTNVHELVRASLLGGKLDLAKESVVWVDNSRLDETAVPFICDLLTAASCLDVLRSEARKVNDPPIRAYIYREAWTRLPHYAVLVNIEDGKAVLSSEWFPRKAEAAPWDKPTHRKIVL